MKKAPVETGAGTKTTAYEKNYPWTRMYGIVFWPSKSI